ncbi:EthD family reductase [Bacillus songklensis]|uniref:EthD family reductase n=1 Tax=Bacillus songklensis TaxID=1069116 RepID=A0ABV8B0J8_9BACI
MAKIMIMYPIPTNKEQFDKLYFEEHVPLTKQLKGVTNTFVNKVVQNVNPNQPFYLIVELEFESLDELLHTTATPEWEKIGEDAKRLTPYLPEPPAVCICD